MYFDKVDDIIDMVINDFYTSIIQKSESFAKIKLEKNFVRFQNDLNRLIEGYIDTLPQNLLEEVTTNSDNLTQIKETIVRYCFIYMFLTIGLQYTGKNEVFINNIVEFSKNQSQFSIKLDNFFNSDSNSVIIQMFYIGRNIINLVSREQIKPELIRSEPYVDNTMEFLNELGMDTINGAFRLKSTNDDKTLQCHNLVKTMIILMLYKSVDKKDLIKMIELSHNTEGEYMFIEIIEPTSNMINFNSIESILDKKELTKGFAHDVWDFLEHIEKKKSRIISSEDKINILINAGIVVPILDDFLLYHTENEKYDRGVSADVLKKKEDTKMRYIINKIDSVTELYSSQSKKDKNIRDNIMKNFYNHLFHRKAIARNNFEELVIISKYMNQTKRNQETNEYLNDLMHHRRYTYVNFKDFENYGFSHQFTKSVQSVRSVNMETTGEFRQSPSQRIQLRIGAKETIGNIVGLMIPTNTRPIQCLKVIECIDVRSLNKHAINGFEIFLSFLKRSKIKRGSHKSSIYWLFDMEKDKFKSMTTEGNISDISMQDNVKNMLSVLYDNFTEAMYFHIIDRMDNYPELTVDQMHTLIIHIENLIGMPCTEEVQKNVERYYFEKRISVVSLNELNDVDILFGLEGNIIELQEYKPNIFNKYTQIIIDTSKVSEIGQLIETEKILGVCQHNITWESLSELRKTNTQEYLKQMYLFIQQYVIENTQNDFVCKSCGYCLDIRRYVSEGTFDNDSQRFITFSMPMEANLEDLPEYEKFNFSIKIMDRNIEKIASSVGISYFVGTGITIKWRRKAIIKNTIDMVGMNNKLLTNKMRERNESKQKLYGISKLSNLFVFDMENNIFQVSTKDKDQEQYKMIKKNNIIVYTMLYMILEMNESHLLFFISDKKNLADIKIFNVVYQQLFSGLRIKINNTNESVDIIKYRILCYMIYMLSCRIAKHRMWFGQQSVEKNIQKMIPIIQKFIVHTTVDLINSIMENSYEPGVSYLFEVFRIRFLTNIRTFYSNDDLYKRLLNQSHQSFVTINKRNNLKIISDDMIKPLSYMAPVWRVLVPTRFKVHTLIPTVNKLFNISNITNCADGQFHKWITEKGKIKCSLCQILLENYQYDKDLSEKIKKKYDAYAINSIAQQLCSANNRLAPHNYIYNGKYTSCNICNNKDTHQYTEKELKKIEEMLHIMREENLSKYYETQKKLKDSDIQSDEYTEKIIDKLKKSFEISEKNNQFGFINKLIDNMVSIVGSEIKGDNVTNLYNNIYIIDHDHNGYDLGGKNIIISQTDNLIQYRQNHPFFKTDCIYYTDNRSGRIDVFYDAISKRLLGYKEQSREFNKVDTNKKIRINYSIANKLKLMGFCGEYIYLNDDYPYLVKDNIPEMTSNEKKKYHRNVIRELSRARIENIKKSINNLQRMMNRMINGYIPRADTGGDPPTKNDKQIYIPENVNTRYFSEKLDGLIDKYANKLRDISISDNKSKHQAFKHWKGVFRGISTLHNSLDDIQIDSDTMNYSAEQISTYDITGNILLFYFVEEINKLLEYNRTGIIRTNLTNFVIEFINRMYERHTNELIHTDKEIRKFHYMMHSYGFMREINETSAPKTGIYEEMVDPDGEKITEEEIEQQIDLDEEMEAIDMDMGEFEEGFASAYDRQVQFEPRTLFDE